MEGRLPRCGAERLRAGAGLRRLREDGQDAGEVRLEGTDIARLPEEELRKIRNEKIGIVFQQFHLFPHRSVLENVIEGPIYVLGQDRALVTSRAVELLRRVGMLEKADSRPASLSGGQQQRVAIARALAMQPDVILFDEPTSALDPEMTAEVTSVMIDLAKSGQTMVVVTHDMGFARSVASQLFVLDRGTIVETGKPNELFADPKHETTRKLLMNR